MTKSLMFFLRAFPLTKQANACIMMKVKEIKMKKILTFCLIAILIVGLGVCGFFTYKYFDLSKNSEANMKVSEAKDLINKVASDMGLTGDKSGSKATTLSINYNDYNGNTINYNGTEDFVNGFVLIAKYAFEGEISEKTYYKSEASYTYNGVSYSGSVKLYFTLNRNVLELHMMDLNINKEAIVKIDNSANEDHEWIMYFYVNGGLDGNDGCFYAEVAANDSKVFDYAYSELKFSSKPKFLDELTPANIESFSIYDCNIKSHKTLNVNKENMTDSEVLQYSKIAIEKVNSQSSANFSDLKTYTNSDFLKKTYTYLGYAE